MLKHAMQHRTTGTHFGKLVRIKSVEKCGVGADIL